MLKKRIDILTVLLTMLCASPAVAQSLALKTNVLYDATATVNAGLEIAVGQRWSIDISGNYNPWDFTDNMKWKHWSVQPEIRFWPCNKLGGHFLGLHLHGGQYNMGNIPFNFKLFNTDYSMLNNYRYEGLFAGGGIGYGYAWMIGRHWNIESEIGFGYSYSQYDKFQCVKCGSKLDSGKVHHWIGPTKAALNLVYVF